MGPLLLILIFVFLSRVASCRRAIPLLLLALVFFSFFLFFLSFLSFLSFLFVLLFMLLILRRDYTRRRSLFSLFCSSSRTTGRLLSG